MLSTILGVFIVCLKPPRDEKSLSVSCSFNTAYNLKYMQGLSSLCRFPNNQYPWLLWSNNNKKIAIKPFGCQNHPVREIILHTHGEGSSLWDDTTPGSLGQSPVSFSSWHLESPSHQSHIFLDLPYSASQAQQDQEVTAASPGSGEEQQSFHLQIDRKGLMMRGVCLIFLSSELKKNWKVKKEVYEQLQNHRIVKVSSSSLSSLSLSSPAMKCCSELSGPPG